MKNSIREELESHVLDRINDGVISNDNKEDWHYHCFNEDYYLIGYYNCEQWLKKHNVGTFEAIDFCQDYEKENFGECAKPYDNAEVLVNMYAYILGEELLSDLDAEDIEELTSLVS